MVVLEGGRMTPEIRAELDLLHTEIQQLWAAIRALNSNDGALLTNIQRLSSRLVVHEAYQAAEEMDDDGRASH